MALKPLIGGMSQSPAAFNAGAPGPIGNVTPSTGAFTTLTATSFSLTAGKVTTIGQMIAIDNVIYQP